MALQYLKSNKCIFLSHFIVPQKSNSHPYQGQGLVLRSVKKLLSATRGGSGWNHQRKKAPLFLCSSLCRLVLHSQANDTAPSSNMPRAKNIAIHLTTLYQCLSISMRIYPR